MPPILPKDLKPNKRYVVLTYTSNRDTPIIFGQFKSEIFIRLDDGNAVFMRTYPEYGTGNMFVYYPIDSTSFFNVHDKDIPIPQPPPARRPLPGHNATATPFVSLVPPQPPPPPPPPPASPWEVPPVGEASWSPPPTPLPQGAPAAQQAPPNEEHNELIQEATMAYKKNYGGRRSYFRLKKRKTKSRKTKKSKKTIKRRR